MGGLPCELKFKLITIITSTAIPIAELLDPYTVSIENTKPEIVIKSPSKKILYAEYPAKTEIENNNRIQIPIPLILWRTGPGTSVILTLNAPKDMAMPMDKFPKYAITKEGIIIPEVIRTPSLKGLPFKKLRYLLRVSNN